MLLLFAVRMVRTGIERSYGARFQQVMTAKRSTLGASAAGVLLAMVLQSSAAVALLASGFAGGGMIAFPIALALVLGGDLGSALVIQILSFDLTALIPALLAVGGWLYVKTEDRRRRQIARILMGIAFILISLQFLREAVEPIQDSRFLPAIANYLANDYLTAFLVGASLAFVMHSSVAAILMFVTLVQIGAIPFAAGLSLLFGANLGSAAIPLWLTRGMGPSARRIPIANFVLRGLWALIALLAANLLFAVSAGSVPETAQMLINVHVAFNTILVLAALPLGLPLERMIKRFVPDATEPAQNSILSGFPEGTLDPDRIGTPAQAIASIKKELLRMSGFVDSMFNPSLDIYRDADPDKIRELQELETAVNTCLSDIRTFVASIPSEDFGKGRVKTIHGLMEYAIRLEAAGDVIAKRITELAVALQSKSHRFSDAGWQELKKMHSRITENIRLASNVLISEDLESARLLSLEKTAVKKFEAQSRKKHLKRVQNGQVDSFETSDIHLETLRALREFNSHISAVAYPLLYREGQLLETRLIFDSQEK
ncbi:MAG: Na/Pi cotransporter family protein [Pseudomonadota bacterium]